MEQTKKRIYKKWWFWLIIILVLIIGLNTSDNKTKETTSKPTEIELMSYAQTVLQDNLSNPKYSRNKADYEFINTNLRYKIEGSVTINSQENKFWIIIEFTDDTFKEYDLISLQVGNDIIYKK